MIVRGDWWPDIWTKVFLSLSASGYELVQKFSQVLASQPVIKKALVISTPFDKSELAIARNFGHVRGTVDQQLEVGLVN